MSAEPITALALADLMDKAGGTDGQWNGADVCDALAQLIASHGGWKQCDDHGNYSASKSTCPFEHEPDPIESLYCVGPSVWTQWLTNERDFAATTLTKLTDDLCNSIGGGNMLTIDMGDEAIVVLPCPHSIRPHATLMLRLQQVNLNDIANAPLWNAYRVLTWGTEYVGTGVVEDSPILLNKALASFLEAIAYPED